MKEESIVYEYISINVRKDLEPIYIDSYKNFGWIHIKEEKRDYYINSNPNLNITEIKFKRNAKINNKEELQKLQRRCEKAFLTVNRLEKVPQALAMSYSLSIGIFAAIFIALSTLSIIGKMWFSAILCGIIGIIGCVFPYSIYKNVKNRKETETKKQIEEQQNIIYETYEQARKILSELED